MEWVWCIAVHEGPNCCVVFYGCWTAGRQAGRQAGRCRQERKTKEKKNPQQTDYRDQKVWLGKQNKTNHTSLCRSSEEFVRDLVETNESVREVVKVYLGHCGLHKCPRAPVQVRHGAKHGHVPQHGVHALSTGCNPACIKVGTDPFSPKLLAG